MIKKLSKHIIFLSVILFLASCSTYNPYTQTKSQYKTLKKFNNKRNYRKGQARWVPFKKRPQYAHPAVRKETKRLLKQRHLEQVWTISKY